MRIIKFYFLISLLAICELTVAQSFKGIDVESPKEEEPAGDIQLIIQSQLQSNCLLFATVYIKFIRNNGRKRTVG